jgi:formylglycine-generating enzyme required for sulfatase activity
MTKTKKPKRSLAVMVTLLIVITVSAQKPTIEWADIPAGTFTMGSPVTQVGRSESEMQHQVTISAFKMSKYEITVEQFDMFLKATRKYNGGMVTYKKMLKQPVNYITWHEAVAFADWLGCRLPTEAEWEYACRAGTTTPFSTGNNLTTKQANYNGDKSPYNNNRKGKYRGETMPVGSFAPNAWGLYDMHGNVNEWCSDWFDFDYPTIAQTDPKGPAYSYFKVIRGGSFGCPAENCTSSIRFWIPPFNNMEFVGFRVVLVQ